MVTGRKNKTLIINKIDVIPYARIHTKDIFELNLLRWLDGGYHLSHFTETKIKIYKYYGSVSTKILFAM